GELYQWQSGYCVIPIYCNHLFIPKDADSSIVLSYGLSAGSPVRNGRCSLADQLGTMRTFFFSAGGGSNQKDLEQRIRAKLPDLQILSRIEEISKVRSNSVGGDSELTCILFPLVLSTPGSFDRMLTIVTQYRDSLFFIFISEDIPASDYKRLVQTGG